MPVTAAAIDADFIGQATAQETVREHTIVVGTQTHAIHVIAVGGRVVDRQMSRPASICRCR